MLSEIEVELTANDYAFRKSIWCVESIDLLISPICHKYKLYFGLINYYETYDRNYSFISCLRGGYYHSDVLHVGKQPGADFEILGCLYNEDSHKYYDAWYRPDYLKAKAVSDSSGNFEPFVAVIKKYDLNNNNSFLLDLGLKISILKMKQKRFRHQQWLKLWIRWGPRIIK